MPALAATIIRHPTSSGLPSWEYNLPRGIHQGALEIDDAVFFDTRVAEEVTYNLLKKPKIRKDAGNLIDPKDRFNFFSNLWAIPLRNQLWTLVLVFVAGIVIAVH